MSTISHSRTPTFWQLLELFWGTRILEFFCARPGRVTKFDETGPKVDVQLLDKIPNGGTVGEAPILPNVPVKYMTCANGGLTFPLAVGDLGLVVFTDALLDSWKGSQGTFPIDPGDDAFSHDINNGVFLPGLWPFEKGPSVDGSDLVLRFGNSELRLADDGTTTLKPDADTSLTMATTGEASIETKSGAKIEITAGGQITVSAPSPQPIIINSDSVRIAGGLPINGVARVGDSVVGGVITTGSSKVFCG